MSMAKRIGAYRFPGWWQNTESAQPGWGNFPINRTTHSDRKPLLGWYDEKLQSVCDAQIKMAAAGGLDHFVYNWYYDHTTKKPVGDIPLNNFLASSVPGMQCAIGFETSSKEVPIASANDWFEILERWVEMFDNPRYLRVDGRPVVFVIKLYHMNDAVCAAAGMDHRKMLDVARSRTGENIYFVANSDATEYWINTAKQAGYDCFSAYNLFATWTQRWNPEKRGPDPTSFKQLAANYKMEWEYLLGRPSTPGSAVWTKAALDMDYWMPLTAGFDDSPWRGTKTIGRATPAEFYAHLLDAKLLMSSARVRGGIVCAWDEIGEGSYIQPTWALGREMLSQVARVMRS